MNEYQVKAMRTNDGKAKYRLTKMLLKKHQMDCPEDLAGIIDGCLGLSGEVGEFTDLIKKWVFHEKAIDLEHAKKELGDVCWYVAMICESFGWDLQDILDLNVVKLEKRYPQGFDPNVVRKEGDV